MSNIIDATLRSVGAPSQTFWENELEISVAPIWEQMFRPGMAETWLAKRTGRQRAVLCRNLAAAGEVLKGEHDVSPVTNVPVLLPYFLIQEYAKYKARAAIVDAGRRSVPNEILRLCEKAKGGYDTLAVCFAIYGARPEELPLVICLNKVHKHGFARMRLMQRLRRPATPFADFLTAERVTEALLPSEDRPSDPGPAELRRVFFEENRQWVFVRRPEEPGKILRAGRLFHGHRPEWVVLEFHEAAKRVNIASTSMEEPLQISNRLASAYFDTPCHYEDERLVSYETQLRRFLQTLRFDQSGRLQLVEIRVKNSPLEGAPRLQLSGSRSIGPALIQLEEAIGGMLVPIERIEAIKVLFESKRVQLQFEKLPDSIDEFIVRYTDQCLSPDERTNFEIHLEEIHGIAVLSTEKRFCDAA